ncbi:hypothetical protein [uncultured Nostoc sp.]|uniref:hypothetical protein n=1 Tax=uncultured Nostoc sp. TaxID=340711 RepID=UPI0035CB1501
MHLSIVIEYLNPLDAIASTHLLGKFNKDPVSIILVAIVLRTHYVNAKSYEFFRQCLQLLRCKQLVENRALLNNRMIGADALTQGHTKRGDYVSIQILKSSCNYATPKIALGFWGLI